MRSAACTFAIGMIAVLVLAGAAAGEVSREGLVGEWHFDGDAKDSSGNGNDGIIHGATFVDGISGKAMSFDGRDDYVSVGNIGTFPSATISFWMYPDVVENHRNPFSAEPVWDDNIRFEEDSSGNFVAGYLCDAAFYTNVTHPLTPKKWYNIVFAYDETNIYGYLNGEIKFTKNICSPFHTDFDSVTIGGGYSLSTPSRLWDGNIDEVRIFNRVLSADEIKAHYELAGTTYQPPAATTSTPSVRIISAPSPIHGGEDVEVTVGWENIPADWKLIVSLEKSDTDKDRLADDVDRTISGSGEAVFKLNLYQIDKTYDYAKVWACLRDENDNWASVLTETSITALPAASPTSQIAATLAPTPQITATLAPTSQITATPASTQKPDDGTTQMLILAGSAIIALLVIALIAGKLRGKRRDATFEPPAPRKTKTTPPSGPTIVAEPGQQSPPPEPITKDVTSKTFNEGVVNLQQTKEQLEASGISNLDIKRGFEVLDNKDLRFGIRIKNISRFTINDVDVLLKYDRELFSVKGQEMKHLGNVPNNKEKTAEFILTPLVACVHHSEISAVISYMDASSNSHTDQMHPKEVHCISPFLAEKPMTEGEFSELYENHSCHVKGIVFKGIRPENVTNYMIDSSKSRRYVVKNSLINGTHVIYLSSTAKDKSYYLLTAIIRSENDMTHVGLRVCSNNEGGINNFMNEILTSLRNYINSVQSAREVENVIVNKSIQIINSVVEGGISMEGNASGRDESINIRSER